jgi:hypothetical protein
MQDKPPIDPTVYSINGKLCRRIPLSQGLYAWVDAHHYNRLMQFVYYAQYSPLKRGFYAKRTLSGGGTRPMQADVKQAPEGILVDHIDSLETLDNREDNLRFANSSQNSMNVKLRKDSSSGRKNVIKSDDRWKVVIMAGGVSHYFGRYKDYEEACRVQEAAVKKLHGEFATRLRSHVESD